VELSVSFFLFPLIQKIIADQIRENLPTGRQACAIGGKKIFYIFPIINNKGKT
jgi:hypothetical protein